MASGQVAHSTQSGTGFPSIVLMWSSMAFSEAWVFPFTPPAEAAFIKWQSGFCFATLTTLAAGKSCSVLQRPTSEWGVSLDRDLKSQCSAFSVNNNPCS